jgi:hypothetical protein
MMDPSAWSFGQIVAVAIWVPPIVEYAYLLMRKCKEYQKLSDIISYTDRIYRRNDRWFQIPPCADLDCHSCWFIHLEQ